MVYRFNIDHNTDGEAEDIVYEVRFSTETRPALGAITGPLPYIGNPTIGTPPSPIPELTGITALDGPGSEGLTRRQTYTATEIRSTGGDDDDSSDDDEARTQLFKGQLLVAVPSNVGPATMPDYEDLASQCVYEDDDIRVFVGQRAETFYINLGAVFDTLNLRKSPPLLNPGQDADDAVNPFGINRFSGFNVSTIALEIPISRITGDGKPADSTAYPVIGMYASTSPDFSPILLKKAAIHGITFV